MSASEGQAEVLGSARALLLVTQLGHSLAAGLTWEWESFPDFMDTLEPPRARHRHRGAGRALADARLCDG
jgi:hypothetical protein